eukprot:c2909_g1_i1.p1 GENE.c2909_g1_i1~~c2909_g1_i1.p1  ORF type:complete len:171 (+),score=57.30 c2909_g1_i1:44-514(+)
MDDIPEPVKHLLLAPSSVIRIPNVRLKIPHIPTPDKMLVFCVLFFSYFLVMSGIIYDIIVEPPGIGSTQDPATGQHKPQAFLPYRINGQYIIEGLSAGFMFSVGATGIILLDQVTRVSGKSAQYIFLGAGGALIALGYNLSIVFIKIKLPGYLRVD